MKRLSPEARGQWAERHIRRLALELTCRYGEWNREKLLAELEKQLKRRRKEQSHVNSNTRGDQTKVTP